MDGQRWQEIQGTFDSLVHLDAVERGNRLTALATTDPELRAAVEALLAADSEADARLAPLEAVVRSPSPAVASPDPLGLTGRTIAHFQVSEPIGAGGMGVVYRAEDTQLGRSVALKFLHPSYSFDETANARFLREAHSAAGLDHPNLCAIHEVGRSDDGQLFLAMPLYAGETLKTRLARGPTAVSEALEIAQQIAAGLECAHAAGIVHRDLKPGNVMLLPDRTVKILDFGLAKARDQSLTATGAVLGTAPYMAPEQIAGEAVDGRADLWALGVVLYEMLTERTPFAREQDIAVAHAILHHEPVPPSTHRGDVSPALDDLVLRLLEKNPAGRYPTASALLSDLSGVRTATAGARPWLRRRLRRGRQILSSSRGRVVTAAAATVLIGAGGYASVVRNSAAPAAPPARTAIAVLPFRNLSADSSHAYFVSGLHDEILSQLYKIPALKVIARSSVVGYSGPKTPPLTQVAEELGVGSIVDASVQVVANKVRVNVQLVDGATEQALWVQQYDRTLEDAFALQSDIAQQIVATVGVVLGGAERSALASVPTQQARAYLLYLQGKEIERRAGGRSRDNLEAAGRLYEQAIALDPSFALAHAALAGYHTWMYLLRYDMTPDRLARQRAAAETALRLAPNSPEAHEAMGGVLNVGPNTNPYAADKQRQRALRLAPNDARLIAGRASFYRQTGNWEDYEKTFRRVVELDPRNADFLSDYGGETHFRMGRFADAIYWHERAASITGDTLRLALTKAWINVHWKGSMELVRAWMFGDGGRIARSKGWIHPQMSYWYLARQPDSMLAVLKEQRQRVWQGAFQFEPVALWRAAAHHMRGDQRAARAELDSALAIADSGVRTYRDDFSVHVARGLALAGLGRRADALDEVRRIRENFLFKDVWVREGMLLGIANIHATLGDADATVAALEELLSQKYTGVTVHMLRLYPDWDRVRQHPRFQALLTKYANHPNLRA